MNDKNLYFCCVCKKKIPLNNPKYLKTCSDKCRKVLDSRFNRDNPDNLCYCVICKSKISVFEDKKVKWCSGDCREAMDRLRTFKPLEAIIYNKSISKIYNSPV